METTALVLIGIALILMVIVIGLLSVLIFKLLKTSTSGPEQKTPHYHPEILDRIKEAQKLTHKRSELFCPNHTEEPGEVTCSICDKLYCKACIKPFKTMHFCKEHLPLIMKNEWDEVLTLKTSTTDPEQGVKLFEIKKELFETDGIPSFIETHYKINVDQDYIETYLVLFGIREQVQELKERLQQFR